MHIFHQTKYAKGKIFIDHYKPEVDGITPPEYKLNWDELKHWLRITVCNSTLSAQMPSESSVVCNATNGIEPPRDFLSIKKSKKGTLKQIVPSYTTLKNNYTLLWDMPSMEGYLNVMAVIQKFFDQSISTNTSYNPQHYEDGEVPATVLVAISLGVTALELRHSTTKILTMERRRRNYRQTT